MPQPQEIFEENNNALLRGEDDGKQLVQINQKNIDYDPLSNHYGWRSFKQSYSYFNENMPQYEYTNCSLQRARQLLM